MVRLTVQSLSITKAFADRVSGRPLSPVPAPAAAWLAAVLPSGPMMTASVFPTSPAGRVGVCPARTGCNRCTCARAALVDGHGGFLYGTTFFGGDSQIGTVFKITTNGALISMYSFVEFD